MTSNYGRRLMILDDLVMQPSVISHYISVIDKNDKKCYARSIWGIIVS